MKYFAFIGMMAALLSAAKKGSGAVATILYPMQSADPTYSSGSASTYAQEAAGGQVVGYGFRSITQRDYALLWSGPSGNFVGLDGDTAGSYMAFATDGSQQVGEETFGTISSAMLWTGAGNQIDLQPFDPKGQTSTFANGLSPTQQVGGVFNSSNGAMHAMLWNGTSASALDINPNAFTYSQAFGTDGSEQVGYGTSGGKTRALLWRGSAASAVDLSQTAYYSSFAYGVGGNQQVGYGQLASGGNDHALLWTGSSTSLVDLNPTALAAIVSSVANGTNGTNQVGYGSLANGNEHALAWSGSAASAFDLQTLLPSGGIWYYSRADTIDSSGNIFGTAYGSYGGNLATFAVEWSASSVPEPYWSPLTLMALLVCCRPQRRPLP